MNPFYAVRHIPTGHYLPTTKKGYTTTEPMDPEVTPPRLHTSYRKANAAMHAWLRGVHVATWDYWSSDDPYSSAGGMYVEDISIKPMPKRIRDHMEIVEIHLNVR